MISNDFMCYLKGACTLLLMRGESQKAKSVEENQI